jgi:hypothetical protein
MTEGFTSWEIEQLRRSIAMLPPGSSSNFTREQALQLLGQLRQALALLEHPSRAADVTGRARAPG